MNLKKSISISIRLDVLKGSVNAMLIPSKHGKRLVYSGGFRQAKIKVKKYLDENYKKYENYFADHPEFYYTTVEYVVFDNSWLTKSSKYRKLRKKDVANYQKNIEDVVYKFLGIDDSSIVSSSIHKKLPTSNDSDRSVKIKIALYELVDKTFIM